MTTLGDIITADTGGTAKRLGVGSEGQVLKVVSGEPAWYDASKDFCHAYIGSAYSTPGGNNWVKIPFDTSLVDTNDIFNEILDRVIPKKPGIYLVIARLALLSGGTFAISAFKNGINTVNLSSYSPSGTLSQLIGTGMLYVNGTTDYIEICVYSSSVVSSSIVSSSTFFQVVGPL